MAEKKPKKKTSPRPAKKKQQTSVQKPAAKKKTTSVPGKKVRTKPVTAKKTAVKTKAKKALKKPSLKMKPHREKTSVQLKTGRDRAREVVKKPIQVTKPSEEERKAMLRKSLLKKRAEILQEAKDEISKYIKGETRQLVDTALDDGDWSVVDLSEDISLRKLGVHRENLQKIDEALRKFNEGTYGICEDCGEEISEERLKILPFAIYCIDCQEKREQFQEMTRREGLL